MMHRSNTFLGLGLLLIAAFSLTIWGCSDDKVPTPTSTVQTGDFENPEFVLVQNQINTYLDETLELYGAGLENIYQLPADTEEVRNQFVASGPNDTVTAFYAEGWHVTYVARHNSFFDDFFRDSVQFIIDGQTSETATGLEELRYIRQWGFQDNQTDETHTNQNGYCNLWFTYLDSEYGMIDGNNNVVYEWNFIDVDSSVVANFEMTVVVEDVMVQKKPLYGWISNCPLAGTLLFDIDEAYIVNNGTTFDMDVMTWDASVTFNSGVATVNVTRDNTIWNYSYDLCTP